jgi:hypothetical protein
MRTRITHISFRALIPLLLFFTLVINAPGLSAAPAGSTYPVQVSPMLIPPYSLYLSDYFSGTTERLSLTLTNRDLQQPQVRVKLRLTIACASGLTLTTHPQAVFDPIVLDAGVPTRLTMQELAPYFLPTRLLTQGYMQGGKLTEGNVEFGFEVLEYNTGKVLSQKNIAFGNIISPKPPKLNLPINNDIVTVNEPQQLTFQWSPQYFSTGNVEYEFVIKELMDKTASPQEAFLYSREVYRTTTTASAINYSMGEPTLEGNKRYAWCVRAVMHDGVETVNRFENDGYSPVSVFDMRYDCRPPMDVQATTERGTIMLRWLPQPHHLKYVVSYRRTDFDANIWYTKTTTSTFINLSDITPGQNYTYRVGAYCDDNTPVYSAPGTISVPAEDTEFLANCGKDPQIKITNRKPKGQLNVNDLIMAGDFPVTITRVSGSSGTFTGEGWVRIPYLFANFGVRFSGIGVNEENRLILGQIETKYDKTENGIVNLDALDQGGTDGNIKSGITKANKTVEFALPEKFTVQYSEELATLTFKDETGTTIGNVDIPKNPAGKPILPLTVEDKNGNVYEVHENPEKSTSSTQPYVAVKLGKQEGEIPFGSMDLNVQDEAQATVTFANDASSLYALDSWQNYYSSVGIISDGNGDPNSNFDGCKYEKISANYWVKWKYIPPGKTDKVTAELLISDKAKIDPAKIVFKAKAGKVFESTYNASTHKFTITLLGGEDKDGQELYAMHPATQSGSWWNLGKLDIMSYAPVERKIVLVKTAANDNTDAAVVQTELNRIYNPVGISWSVSTDNFEYDTQALFDKSSGILSAYNAQMRALNAAYTAAKGTIDSKIAYLFLVSQSSDKNNREVQGFMPRGMQFGYICNGCLTNQKLYSTIAHELGHGVFRLRHIFSTDYGSTAVGMKEKTQFLMDYADGINLPKWQWDQMYDPAILNGVFDSDKEADWATDGHYYTVQLVARMMGVEAGRAKELGAAAEEPDSHVVSDKNMEERDTWMIGRLQQRYHALTGGYHGVELAVTAYALTKTHTDNASFQYLMHRFGDDFAHFNVGYDQQGLTNVLLKDYISAFDTYIDNLINQNFVIFPQNRVSLPYKYHVNESGKVETKLSKDKIIHDFVDFMLQGEHGSSFIINSLRWETCQDEILKILPYAIQNKFKMYGKDQTISCLTTGHLTAGKTPDNIVDRKKIFILYIGNLIDLIAIKEGLNNDKAIIQNKFSAIIDHIKYSTVDRLDGIYAYEIAKLNSKSNNPIYFFVPVKYIVKKHLTTAGNTYNSGSDLNKNAEAIKEDTYKYLNKVGAFQIYFIENRLKEKDGAKYIEFKLIKK